jgi:hypothetical protein
VLCRCRALLPRGCSARRLVLVRHPCHLIILDSMQRITRSHVARGKPSKCEQGVASPRRRERRGKKRNRPRLAGGGGGRRGGRYTTALRTDNGLRLNLRIFGLLNIAFPARAHDSKPDPLSTLFPPRFLGAMIETFMPWRAKGSNAGVMHGAQRSTGTNSRQTSRSTMHGSPEGSDASSFPSQRRMLSRWHPVSLSSCGSPKNSRAHAQKHTCANAIDAPVRPPVRAPEVLGTTLMLPRCLARP